MPREKKGGRLLLGWIEFHDILPVSIEEVYQLNFFSLSNLYNKYLDSNYKMFERKKELNSMKRE